MVQIWPILFLFKKKKKGIGTQTSSLMYCFWLLQHYNSSSGSFFPVTVYIWPPIENVCWPLSIQINNCVWHTDRSDKGDVSHQDKKSQPLKDPLQTQSLWNEGKAKYPSDKALWLHHKYYNFLLGFLLKTHGYSLGNHAPWIPRNTQTYLRL